MRGPGASDHVFLYRNQALRKDLVRARLQIAGEAVGVKVYPHRLRHTCATQLFNAGCRITSIQKFLGHKKLNTTMIYARAHDQTVADDYFAAMARIEQRLEFALGLAQEGRDEVVKVQERTRLCNLPSNRRYPSCVSKSASALLHSCASCMAKGRSIRTLGGIGSSLPARIQYYLGKKLVRSKSTQAACVSPSIRSRNSLLER